MTDAEIEWLRGELAESQMLMRDAQIQAEDRGNSYRLLKIEADALTAQRDIAVGERDVLMKRVEEQGARLGRIAEWTHVHGRALCPRGADTYGEGMRDAKIQVASLVRAKP